MLKDHICQQEPPLERHARLHKWAPVGKVLAVVFVVALTAAILVAVASGRELQSLGALGYPGVFLTAFLSSATILIPVPGLALTVGAGAVWHPLLIGIMGGAGAAAGEMVGYFAGRAGLSGLKGHRNGRWRTAESWLRRFGFWAILLVAVIPNPFFDALGLVAGALAYPAGRFWVAAAAGNCAKYVAFALLGSGIPLSFS